MHRHCPASQASFPPKPLWRLADSADVDADAERQLAVTQQLLQYQKKAYASAKIKGRF